MKQIYQHMALLNLKKEFWRAIGFRVLLCGIVAVWTGAKGCPTISIWTFCVYGVFHHFYSEKAVYDLKATYRTSHLSPEKALKAYQTEICFLHMENNIFRQLWVVAAFVMLLPVFLRSELLCIPVGVVHLVLIYKEYHFSEYCDETIKKQ